jgi:hypothetical protein
VPEITLLKPRRLFIHGVMFERGKPKMASAAIGRTLDGRPNVKVDWTKTGPVEPGPVEEARDADGRPKDKATRIEAIRDAMTKLDPDNESHYTRSGKPDARALTEILGWQVSAADRDEALAIEPGPDDPAEDDHLGEEDKPATSRVKIIRKPRAEVDPSAEGAVEV